MSTTTGNAAGLRKQPVFVTTRWTVVLAAGGMDTTKVRQALEHLCRTYWYPLYVYVRRRGYSAHDAQDLTQAFFARLLTQQSMVKANPDRGRFRSFILTAMNNFLASEWKRGSAQKRGGGYEMLSLELAAAEKRYELEPATHSSPTKIFEKQWAMTLLEQVLNRLELEFQDDGKADLFAALKPALLGLRESQPYVALATQLGMNESAVKVAVHRLRKRYRELIRDEIANTLDPSEEIEVEMQHLLRVLAE
jgi:RNA polymerase sigma-70 factor (ECF subfamily)